MTQKKKKKVREAPTFGTFSRLPRYKCSAMCAPFCVFRNAEAYVVSTDPPAAAPTGEREGFTLKHGSLASSKVHAVNSANDHIAMNKDFIANLQIPSSLLRETIYEDTLSTVYNIRNNGMLSSPSSSLLLQSSLSRQMTFCSTMNRRHQGGSILQSVVSIIYPTWNGKFSRSYKWEASRSLGIARSRILLPLQRLQATGVYIAFGTKFTHSAGLECRLYQLRSFEQYTGEDFT